MQLGDESSEWEELFRVDETSVGDHEERYSY